MPENEVEDTDVYPQEDNRAAVPVDGPVRGRVAILTAQYYEDSELFAPYYQLFAAGYAVDVLTPVGGPVESTKGVFLKQGIMRIADAHPGDYELLYIPGGKRAPATLVEDKTALDFIRTYVATGGIISSMCHGGRVLAAAGVIEGKRVTGWRDVADEMCAAGGIYVDEAGVEDGQFITGRKPSDIPRIMVRILDRLRAAKTSATVPDWLAEMFAAADAGDLQTAVKYYADDATWHLGTESHQGLDELRNLLRAADLPPGSRHEFAEYWDLGSTKFLRGTLVRPDRAPVPFVHEYRMSAVDPTLVQELFEVMGPDRSDR